NGSLANNDVITCVMTSNATCASPVTATSNTITMIVNSVLTPTVSIAASPSGAICAGTSVTFTASPTNGGTPVYQWQLNGSNVGNNTNTYVNGSLANNDVITCVMTSNATCASPVTATSNTITISIISAATVPSVPSGLTIVCSGSTVSYTSSAMYNLGYIWTVTPSNAGSASGNGALTDITWSGTYTGSAVVSVSAYSACDTSLTASLTVNVGGAPSLPIPISGPDSVCSGTSSVYSTSSTGATAFVWDVTPAYAANVNNLGSTLNVSWSNLFAGPATITVYALNACDTTSVVSLNVQVDTTIAQLIFHGGFGTLCQGTYSSTYTAICNNATGFNWSISPASAGTISGTGNTSVVYWDPGFSGNATIYVSAFNNCDSTPTLSMTVTILPGPGTPVITVNGLVLTSTPAYAYQWYVNGSQIPTGTQQSDTALITGDYFVVVQGSNGCMDTSAIVHVDVNTGIEVPASMRALSIYPNPFSGVFYIEFDLKTDSEVQIGIFDLVGRKVAELPTEDIVFKGKHLVRIDGDELNLADGSYLIRIMIDGAVAVKHVVRIK
ncbi:MAG: T9SS type A sorting domain-containing protein, partial [Bacteroidota bacterium]